MALLQSSLFCVSSHAVAAAAAAANSTSASNGSRSVSGLSCRSLQIGVVQSGARSSSFGVGRSSTAVAVSSQKRDGVEQVWDGSSFVWSFCGEFCGCELEVVNVVGWGLKCVVGWG